MQYSRKLQNSSELVVVKALPCNHVGLQELARKTATKHLSDCVLHCSSDFFYLPTVKDWV